MIAFNELTWLHGKPQGQGLLKASPEDFVVVEDLGFEPDGEGEHVLVRILKKSATRALSRTRWQNFLKSMPGKSALPGRRTSTR